LLPTMFITGACTIPICAAPCSKKVDMDSDYSLIAIRLLAAVVAGGLIGLERSYNGRPAGFRTHSLVCMASSLLMLLTVFQWQLLQDVPVETIRVDPTRMAQGIMTGIGFLGAGVIMKDELTIRGLTTAASIWVTASIGILIGMGSYLTASIATVLALGILSTFRLLEKRIPSLSFGDLAISTLRKDMMTEDEINEVLRHHEMVASTRSYSLCDEGRNVRYEMVVHTRKPSNFRFLAEELGGIERIIDFTVTPRTR